MSGRGAPGSGAGPGRAERARDKVRNNKGERDRSANDPRRRGASRHRNQSVGTDGSYHSVRKGWKHQELLGGGPVGEPEWTPPDVGLAEEHGWRRQWTGWYYIGMRGAHRDQFNRASAVFGKLKPSQVIYHLGSDRRVVLASGSFLRPLCRVDPD